MYTGDELEFIKSNRWKAKALGRGASATELASVMLFLSCEESSWVTGAVIPVDGGETLLLASTVIRNLTSTGAY
jgi:NAD(P)-dependent dehydrogenase (short-subunit alcohol dehydrogenase family)